MFIKRGEDVPHFHFFGFKMKLVFFYFLFSLGVGSGFSHLNSLKSENGEKIKAEQPIPLPKSQRYKIDYFDLETKKWEQNNPPPHPQKLMVKYEQFWFENKQDQRSTAPT